MGVQKRCAAQAEIQACEVACQGEKHGPVVPASFLLMSIVHICLFCKIPTSRCCPVIFPGFGLLWRNSKGGRKHVLCKQLSLRHPSLVLPINLAFLRLMDLIPFPQPSASPDCPVSDCDPAVQRETVWQQCSFDTCVMMKRLKEVRSRSSACREPTLQRKLVAGDSKGWFFTHLIMSL